VVGVDGAHRALVENLLGDVYLFEDPDAAFAFVASEAGSRATAVALSGVAVSRAAGIYFAGGATEEFSLLGRSGDLDRAREAIPALEAEIASAESECGEARAARERLAGRAREIETELAALRGERAARNEELQVLERDLAGCREKAALLMRAVDEIETARVETLSKLEEMKLSLKMQEELGSPADGAEMESELASLQKRKEELEAATTERRVALASLRGGLEKDREEQRGLAEMEQQFRAIADERRREIDESTVELGELESGIASERGTVRGLLDEETGFERSLDALAGTLEERGAEAEAAEKELKARAAERERLFEKLNETKIALSTIGARMSGLVEKGKELYGEDLGCYLEGEELPLTPEEEAITREMLDKERRKLESIGPVNLAAVDEYAEKKTRLDFLEAQKADLVKAAGELVEAIGKINSRAREQFLETYNAVRAYFQETFKILFEGGEADLALGEGVDPLEADIIITARPRGKRLQDIALLSGGERALTALALLFALYKAKPSPFCIFDEVDAPLDDANIQRFVRMLQVFKKDTQFIIITHNKRTMEAAEQLYGVTMEERGVSRVVSVDFAGIEKVMKNRETAGRAMLPSEISSSN
jgi:chromosome segregation protein